MASKSIIFVDSRVSDYRSLIDSLTERAGLGITIGGKDDSKFFLRRDTRRDAL